MYRAAKARGQFSQMVHVEVVVVFRVKARGTIVAALDDVPRNTRKAQACAAGHDDILIEDSSPRLAEKVVCSLWGKPNLLGMANRRDKPRRPRRVPRIEHVADPIPRV